MFLKYRLYCLLLLIFLIFNIAYCYINYRQFAVGTYLVSSNWRFFSLDSTRQTDAFVALRRNRVQCNSSVSVSHRTEVRQIITNFPSYEP